MTSKAKLIKRLENWKEKARERADKLRYLRKENKRHKNSIKKIKKELRKAKKEVEKANKKLEEAEKQIEAKKDIIPINSKEDLVFIALQLFFIAKISFRATSRVLHVIDDYFGIQKAPCTQTIINWVMRLSIARMQHVSQLINYQGGRFSNGYIALIDISIALGIGKIFTILFLKSKHHLTKEAPTLEDVICVGVSVADTWTGETIADFVQKLIAVVGKPDAYLKDGGADLDKGVRILAERGLFSPSIDDISHMIANLLKHEYADHPMFDIFMSACGRISKKVKQTILACFAPPKRPTKARFMKIHLLIKWADQLLKQSPKGRAPAGSVLLKLRASFDRLPECKNFISSFLRDANALLACQKLLKTEGLNHVTYKQCEQLMEIMPSRSGVKKGFINWMENQLSVAATLYLDKIGLPISSDPIESFFSVAKRHGTGEIKDANQIALRMPAITGTLTREDAQSVLKVTVKEQQNILNGLPSVIQQRRQILPNPGHLEKLQFSYKKQNLELIPESKNRSKNVISPCFDKTNNKNNGSLTNKEEQSRSPPTPCTTALAA